MLVRKKTVAQNDDSCCLVSWPCKNQEHCMGCLCLLDQSSCHSMILPCAGASKKGKDTCTAWKYFAQAGETPKEKSKSEYFLSCQLTELSYI